MVEYIAKTKKETKIFLSKFNLKFFSKELEEIYSSEQIKSYMSNGKITNIMFSVFFNYNIDNSIRNSRFRFSYKVLLSYNFI